MQLDDGQLVGYSLLALLAFGVGGGVAALYMLLRRRPQSALGWLSSGGLGLAAIGALVMLLFAILLIVVIAYDYGS